MRPGRRSVTTSFLPGTHFSPLREARAWRLSVANVIYSLRGCVVVNAALAAASLTIRADSTAHAKPGSALAKVFWGIFLLKKLLLNRKETFYICR